MSSSIEKRWLGEKTFFRSPRKSIRRANLKTTIPPTTVWVSPGMLVNNNHQSGSAHIEIVLEIEIPLNFPFKIGE